MGPVTVYLGLGSNLGRREEYLAQAVYLVSNPALVIPEALTIDQDWSIELVQSSRVYETPPWGYKNQADFLNCVLGVQTTIKPTALLHLAKAIERKLGRQPSRRFGPRVVDIDILLYGDQRIDLPGLTIPHPRLHQRAFVLVPLAELAPSFMHPTLGVTISQLESRTPDRNQVKAWGAVPQISHEDTGPKNPNQVDNLG